MTNKPVTADHFDNKKNSKSLHMMSAAAFCSITKTHHQMLESIERSRIDNQRNSIVESTYISLQIRKQRSPFHVGN